MIIVDSSPELIGEALGESSAGSRDPYTVKERGSIALREIFPAECGAVASHHIEEHCLRRSVRIGKIISIIAGAERPGVVIIVGTVVFGIDQQDIDTAVRLIGLEEPRYFKKNSYTTGSVVGSGHRFLPLRRVGIFICPRTRVPMREEKKPVGSLRIITAYYIYGLQLSAVESLQSGFLQLYLRSVAAKLRSEPCRSSPVTLRIGHPRPESELTLNVAVGAVGRKGNARSYRSYSFRIGG